MTFHLAPAAQADLAAIAGEIGADNPAAAWRWLDRIEQRCARLGDFPRMGVPRDDVRPGLRLSPVGSHLILYRVVAHGVVIVRVIDGRRRWEWLLGEGGA